MRTKPEVGERGSSRRQFGVRSLITGSAAGQVVTIALALPLSRLYSPDEFGAFAVVAGIAIVLASISALRLELAIVLPQDDDDAYGVVWLSFVCVAVVTVLGTLLTWMLGDTVALNLGAQYIAPYMMPIAPLAGLISVFAILNQLAIRNQRFGAIAGRNFIQQAVGGISQVAGGLLSWGYIGLLCGTVCGQAAGILTLVRTSRLGSAPSKRGRRRSVLKKQFSRYKRFPLYLTPAALFNNLSQQAPILLIAGFYGAGSAGSMSLTQRILAVPAAVVGLAVAQVYLGALARSAATSTLSCTRLFWRTSRKLAVIGLSGGLILLVLAPTMFTSFFGPDWSESGHMAQAMAPLFALQMIASPVSPTLIVFEVVRTQLVWDAARLGALFASVAVSWYTDQPVLTAVVTMSAAGSAMYVILWIICWRTLKRAEVRRRDGDG